MDTIVTLVLGFVVLIYSVILHEIAHGFVAEKLGDPTARRAGRLTLNPLPHIDPLMTILIPGLLYVATHGAFVFGGAKPVPINPLYFDDPKKDTALVAAAGATTNFILAGLGALLFHICAGIGFFTALPVLQLMTQLNLILAIFNLIPVPPLDGSRILAALLPNQYAAMLMTLEPFGIFILLILLFFTGIENYIFLLMARLMQLLGVPSA